ncbi:MAG: endonuclease [Prolixibacteraceae bacterium]
MKLYLSLGLFLILSVHFQEIYGQNNLLQQKYSLMFYNTENFFDCENDSLTTDDEFTPGGSRRWTWKKFQGKTDRLAKTVMAAGKWNAPIIVGLCEIENMKVLEYLVRNPVLSKFNYKIVYKNSPDIRGIDVALLYRPELFIPFDYEAIPVVDSLDLSFHTRDILMVSGVLNGCDTLHIFVNHWPSRYGGIMETKRFRNLAAETLKKAVLKTESRFRNANIICMGDFNDNALNESIAEVLDSKLSDDPDNPGELINLSGEWLSGKIQTIKNQYSWNVFDQFIVSDYILSDTTCLNSLKAEIFSPDFLLEPDEKFGGVKPRRTYVGFNHQEGFSDHLPVLLRFNLKSR